MRPFPFNLTGPKFLLFFAVFGVCTAFFPLLRRRMQDADPTALLPRVTDPIQIATLRGGYEEAVRLLVVILVDRGFVERNGTKLTAIAKNAGYLTNKLEGAVFSYFTSGNHPSGVFHDPAVRAAGFAVEESLESLGLRVPRAQRTNDCLLSIAVFGGVAALRIALSGPPFQFLVLETVGLILVAAWVRRQGLNGRGLRLLSQLRELFARLKARASKVGRGAQGQEAALLAAVFGFGALPFAVGDTLRMLKPPSNSSGGGSCGSSSCGGGGGPAVGAAAEDAADERPRPCGTRVARRARGANLFASRCNRPSRNHRGARILGFAPPSRCAARAGWPGSAERARGVVGTRHLRARLRTNVWNESRGWCDT